MHSNRCKSYISGGNMSKNAFSEILFLALVWTLLFNYSCKKEPEEEPNISVLPPFIDPIPYHLLGQGKLVFNRIGPEYNSYSVICVIDADQHQCRNFDCGLVFAPSVSPNGDKIALMKWGTDQTSWDIYITDINGKNQKDITSLVGTENDPSWTFDGTRVLFSLDCFYTNINLTEVLYCQSPVADPTDRIQILDYNTIDSSNTFIGTGLVSSSLTGKLLIMQAGLRTFDEDGSNMRLIFPYDENSDHFIYSPAWSPDGTKIAFLSFKRNSDISVITIDPDGTDPDTLISLKATGNYDWLGYHNQISLCWSPDGLKIAFTLPDGQTVGSHIYLIGTDHTGLTQVTFAEGVSDFSLSWSH
jgi:Tol biopolymer transport system component